MDDLRQYLIRIAVINWLLSLFKANPELCTYEGLMDELAAWLLSDTCALEGCDNPLIGYPWNALFCCEEHWSIAYWTPEQIEKRLASGRKEGMTPEQIEKKNANGRKYYANRTPEQIGKKIASRRKAQKNWYTNMTPEQRKKRNGHDKERYANRTPEQIEADKEYNREWYAKNREHAKQKSKAYKQTPKAKAYEKARAQTPERKAYDKARKQTPKAKAYKKAYYARKKAERLAAIEAE